jgi:hypothetical protein
MQDITDLKEVVQFGLVLKKAGMDIFAGGKFNASALPELVNVYTAAVPAIAGYEKVMGELENLSKEQIADLMTLVTADGSLSAHSADVLLNALETCVAGYALFKAIKG